MAIARSCEINILRGSIIIGKCNKTLFERHDSMRLLCKNRLPWSRGEIVRLNFEKRLWFDDVRIADDFACRFRSLWL